MRVEPNPMGTWDGDTHNLPADQQPSSSGWIWLKRALNELRMAIAELRPDGICAAYEKLQKVAQAADFKDPLKLIEQALGVSGRDVVVSAYTFRHCIMCADGTVPCPQCEGTGQIEEGRKCGRCDGLGLEPCDLCMGTGWGDINTIPHEIRAYVLRRQLAQVQADLNQLGKGLEKLTDQSLKELQQAKRVKVATWLMKLQARLSELARTELANNEQERTKFIAVASKIDERIEAIRKL
ncbi:MAG: hypothetical protein HZA50_09300 [Planctomycetes bacterium]|nr:hypothetical protein [Planctomycetota bacterium]